MPTWSRFANFCRALPPAKSGLQSACRGLGIPVRSRRGRGSLCLRRSLSSCVVAQAVLGMMRSLAPDRERSTIAVVAAVVVLWFPTAWGQVAAIALGGLAGLALWRSATPADHVSLPMSVSRVTGTVMLALFFVLLIGLPLLALSVPSQSVKLFDAFYRAGSLVFGGGHVVLPLLQASVVCRPGG